jgi:two-component system, chemotaxis family, sensor kinase CheA
VTDRVDLRDFIAGFIAESDELVAAANASLLEIETGNLVGAARPRAVRELFRALHTIKGLAGMVGVEPIVELAHAVETLVRAADRAGGLLGREAVDASLRGVAAIAERVRAVSAQQPPAPVPAELLEAIAASATSVASVASARPASAEPPSARAWDAGLAADDRQQLVAGWRAGRRAWRMTFVPSDELAARGISIGSVRAHVARLGEIIKVVPRATPEQPSSVAFDLVVTSDASAAALAEAIVTTEDQLIELLAPSEPAGAPLDPGAEGLDPLDGTSASMLGRPLVRVELARLDELQDQLSLLIVSRFRLAREIAAHAERGHDVRGLREIAELQGRQLRDLRRAILRARMVRVAEVLEPLVLLVRSLARSAQKEVRLALEARDVELDKAVADRLLPALVHLVRNAVDHAIEPADQRVAAGKPRVGTVTVSCLDVVGNRLELVVQDDGRGIDRGAVAARAKRVVDSDEDLLDVLTAPGFSTRDVVTRTSGRGLGMDIVRRIATGDLGGDLVMSTTPGAGTAFTLRVPLTIAVVDVFSFACGPQTFVVPVSSVEEIFELGADQAVMPPALPGARSPVQLTERRGRAIPLRSLGSLLAIDGGTHAQKAIVIRRQGEPIGFTVDRMLGRHEVVVRPVEDVLVKVPGIAGSTDLGDGRPTLVLDLYALSARAAGGQV